MGVPNLKPENYTPVVPWDFARPYAAGENARPQ